MPAAVFWGQEWTLNLSSPSCFPLNCLVTPDVGQPTVILTLCIIHSVGQFHIYNDRWVLHARVSYAATRGCCVILPTFDTWSHQEANKKQTEYALFRNKKKKKERSYRASHFKNSYAKQFPVSSCAGAPLRWVQRSTTNTQLILLQKEIHVLTLTLLEVKGMKDTHPDALRSTNG